MILIVVLAQHHGVLVQRFELKQLFSYECVWKELCVNKRATSVSLKKTPQENFIVLSERQKFE